jgi:hypothetical protein
MHKIIGILVIGILTSCTVNKAKKSANIFSGDQIGCGDFIIYKLSKDNAEYISIAFNSNEIEYKDSQSYGIGKANILEVRRAKFDGAIHETLCSDVIVSKPKELINEVALSGLIGINLTANDMEKAKNKEPYFVTLSLRNVIFENYSIEYLRIENVKVGWLPD